MLALARRYDFAIRSAYCSSLIAPLASSASSFAFVAAMRA
jgi:hypothetical protein